MSSPHVSVIISTYNRQEQLRRAIVSVLSQTFTDFELIIVDNASTDATPQVVQSFTDGRIIDIRHEQNLGGPAARNTGIKCAKSALIAFLDDDDEWFPQKLEKQFHLMKQASPQCGLVYVGSEIFDERSQKVLTVNHPQYKGQVYQRLLLGTILSSVSSVMVKRECFERIGTFDEDLKSCQDWDMWLRIARGYEFDFVSDTLARINMHGEQISTNYAALIPGRTRMVEKHKEEFQKYPAIYAVHLKRLGKLHFINGTWKQGVPWFRKAMEVNPLEFFKILAWVCLELPGIKLFSLQKDFKKYKANK